MSARVSALLRRPLQHDRAIKNSLWAMLAQLGRLVSQVVYIVLITRSLGVEQYGALAASLAVIFTLYYFSGAGMGNVLVMLGARDPRLIQTLYGNVLICILATGTLLVLGGSVFGALLLPDVSFRLFVLLGASELVFARITETSSQAFLAAGHVPRSAQLNFLLSFSRLVATISVVSLLAAPTIEEWALGYLGFSILTTVISVSAVMRAVGTPHVSLDLLRRELSTGGWFSVSAASGIVYTDMDKALLARLATTEITGVYAAAYRATNLAFMPILSILYATYARFFQEGEKGIHGSFIFAKRLLPISMFFGIAASVGLFVLAPLAPVVLGPEYGETPSVIRLLAILPLLQSMHYLAADALTGAGHQKVRTLIQLAVAFLSIGLNVVLIPMFSWTAAASVAIAADCILVCALWAAVLFLKFKLGDASRT